MHVQCGTWPGRDLAQVGINSHRGRSHCGRVFAVARSAPFHMAFSKTESQPSKHSQGLLLEGGHQEREYRSQCPLANKSQ
jgi:hypothetical protein